MNITDGIANVRLEELSIPFLEGYWEGGWMSAMVAAHDAVCIWMGH